MPEKEKSELNYNPIIKGIGVTPAERYLKRLCEKTFLSLWSFPVIYRNQGQELCDLLVVFGNDIIIFFDKYCPFPNTDDINLNWKHWFRRAIEKSAQQAWGTENWIKNNPDRIFLDSKCSKIFPINLPDVDKTKFHIIVVAHGITRHISGSGSLMINSELIGISKHIVPFTIGDLDANKTFVHVLDDTSLDILANNLDTIYDFVAYLRKKENLVRSNQKILAAGEEELLAVYLSKMNEQNEHDFIFSPESTTYNNIAIPEGRWEGFNKNPQRIAQIEEDKISYMWDRLIETFNYNALKGTTQNYLSKENVNINNTEKAIRFMAWEPRWKRRHLAKTLYEMLKTTPLNHRKVGFLSREKGDSWYIFFLFPPRPSSISEENYRKVRGTLLLNYCLVLKLLHHHGAHVHDINL